MNIQDYILIAAVAVFCIIGMWNVIAISRKHKASKPKTDKEKERKYEKK